MLQTSRVSPKDTIKNIVSINLQVVIPHVTWSSDQINISANIAEQIALVAKRTFIPYIVVIV